MTTLSICVLFGGGGESANYWGRGVKLGLRHACSFTRLPGHVQLQQTLFTIHAIFVDGIKPGRTWFLSGKTCYHLHGQTGRFTVWVNGKQNSRLVNFTPESCSPFVRISSIYRKTTEKAWNWCQRWLWRNGPRISVWNILSGKRGQPNQMFRCCRRLSLERPK